MQAAAGYNLFDAWPRKNFPADFDGDGAVDCIRFNDSGSHFQVGYRVTHPDFIWLPSSRLNPFGGFQGGISIATGDVNNDGLDDLLISSFAHQAIAVYHGSSTRANALASHELKRVGAGPAGMAFGQFDTTTPWLELAVPLLGELQPRTVQVRPQSGWSVANAPMDTLSAPLAAGFEDFAVLAPGTSTAGGRHSGNLAGYIFGTELPGGQASRWMRVSQLNTSGSAALFTLTEPWTQLLAADMRGPNGPGQFVLWAPGVDSVGIATVLPPTGANAPPLEEVSFVFHNITWVAQIGGPGRDRLAVLHNDGARVSVMGWNGTQFAVEQVLDAPAGRTFKRVGGLKWRTFPGGGLNLDDGLFLELSDGTFATHVFDAGGVLVPAAQGALPALPGTGGHATVTLYTDDPLSGSAFEFQSFAAGDWATDAVFTGGEIDALSEIFQSLALGLGSPAAVTLTPFADPGATAEAQANQFGDASSSLFFAGGVSMDGDAAVNIAPAPGVYGAAVQVTFAPAQPGTTVIYRVNGGAWQQAGAGGFFLDGDALVDYYGQAAGGALGTIHSAHYEITPAFAADANGDYLPDAVALALGLNPGTADSDGDGVTNINELLNGSDPRSAASVPAALDVTLPPTLAGPLNVLAPPPVGLLGDAPVPNGDYSTVAFVGGWGSSGPVVNGLASFTAAPGVLPSRRADEPGLTDIERALVAEVTLPGTDADARGPSLYGMAFAPGYVLPQLPDGTPTQAEIEQWLADTRAAAGPQHWKLAPLGSSASWKVDADTTLAVAAFTAWTTHRLAERGVDDPAFAWDHRGAHGSLPAHELTHTVQQMHALEFPAAPATPAYDLGEVARGFYTALATGTNYAPLRSAAREMIRRDMQQPAAAGRIHNAAQALLHFLDTGELESFYAASITQTMTTLTAQRAQLLALPQPRAVRTLEGRLFLLPDGRHWAIELAGGEVVALLDGRRIATGGPGGLTFPRQPAGEATLPIWHQALVYNEGLEEVRAYGFTLPPSEPHPAGSHAGAEVLTYTIVLTNVTLRAGINDLDSDRLDDAFEQHFFNTLAHTFDDDTDGDGFFNGEEYFLLTDPASAASKPAGVTTAPQNVSVSQAPEGLCVCWDGRPGMSYAVEESGDLSGWGDSAALPVETTPGRFQWTNPGTAARLFIRIVTEFE